jgi:hypothetical protein
MPNTIKAMDITVTKVFSKFFIAQDTFRKADGTEGKINYKVWSSHPVKAGQVVTVTGNASASVNEFTDKQGQPVVYGQLTINANEVVVSTAGAWEVF